MSMWNCGDLISAIDINLTFLDSQYYFIQFSTTHIIYPFLNDKNSIYITYDYTDKNK